MKKIRLQFGCNSSQVLSILKAAMIVIVIITSSKTFLNFIVQYHLKRVLKFRLNNQSKRMDRNE